MMYNKGKLGFPENILNGVLALQENIEHKREDTEKEQKAGIRLGRLCVFVCVVIAFLVLFCMAALWRALGRNPELPGDLLWIQCLWLAGILAAVIFLAVIIYRQVIRVLLDFENSISNNARLAEDGVYELRRLARTHNASLEQSRRLERSLRSKADHDVLTGLFNRGGFKVLFEKAARQGEGQGAFMIMDVDCFKDINDTYGHATGDLALQHVANILRESFRSGDLVGRYGGDEFITWMPGISQEHAEYVSNRVRSLNQKLAAAAEGIPALSISAGVFIGNKQMEFSEIFRRADKALYFVKEHGRQGCCIYDQSEVIR